MLSPDAPVRAGYLQATASLSSIHGYELRGEAGYRFHKRVASYGVVSHTQRETYAGLGIRVDL